MRRERGRSGARVVVGAAAMRREGGGGPRVVVGGRRRRCGERGYARGLEGVDRRREPCDGKAGGSGALTDRTLVRVGAGASPGADGRGGGAPARVAGVRRAVRGRRAAVGRQWADDRDGGRRSRVV